MIDAISARDRLLEQRNSSVWLTTKKIQETALYLFAALDVLIGGLLLGEALILWSFTLVVPVSLTIICVGVTAFLVARDLLDYEDKDELDMYRQEIRNLVDILEEEEKEFTDPTAISAEFKAEVKCILKTCIEKHGFKNMFRYGIPHPNDFTRIWNFMSRHMDLKEIIDLYTLFTSEYQRMRNRCPDECYSFDIPSPKNFRDKWHYSHFCEEISEVFDVEQLRQFKLVSQGTYDLLKTLKAEYNRVKSIYDRETSAERKIMQTLVGNFQKQKEEAKRIINRRFRNHPAQQALVRLRADKVKEFRLLNRSMSLDPELQRAEARHLSMMRELTQCGRDGAMDMEERVFARTRAAVETRFAPFRIQIENRFNEQRRSYIQVLHMLEIDHRRDLCEVDRQYDEQVGAIQRRFEEACHVPLAAFRAAKTDLNRRWREYRRPARV